MVVSYLAFLLDMVEMVWVLGPPNLPPKKLVFCIDGDNLFMSRRSDYSSMICSNKYRFSSSFSQKGNDKFSAAGDGRDGVGPIDTHFSSHNVNSGKDRHDGWFQTFQCHFIASLVV